MLDKRGKRKTFKHMTVDNCKKKSKEFDVQQIKGKDNIDWMATIKTIMAITVNGQ